MKTPPCQDVWRFLPGSPEQRDCPSSCWRGWRGSCHCPHSPRNQMGCSGASGPSSAWTGCSSTIQSYPSPITHKSTCEIISITGFIKETSPYTDVINEFSPLRPLLHQWPCFHSGWVLRQCSYTRTGHSSRQGEAASNHHNY